MAATMKRARNTTRVSQPTQNAMVGSGTGLGSCQRDGQQRAEGQEEGKDRASAAPLHVVHHLAPSGLFGPCAAALAAGCIGEGRVPVGALRLGGIVLVGIQPVLAREAQVGAGSVGLTLQSSTGAALSGHSRAGR